MEKFDRFIKWQVHFWRWRLGIHLRRSLLQGLLILIPMAITFVVLRFLFDYMDGLLGPVVEDAMGRSVKGVGIVALVILVYLVGVAWHHGIGRKLIQAGQNALLETPFVDAVYKPARQLIDSFSGSGTSGFKRVVAIEYPKEDSWTLGFLTASTKAPDGTDMGIVYVPTTPNPTSGFMLMMSTDVIYETDLTVNEAMSMVLSGGITTPTELEIRTSSGTPLSLRRGSVVEGAAEQSPTADDSTTSPGEDR